MSKKQNTVDMSAPMEFRNAFKYELVSELLNHLTGEILTIIDASIDGEKNKAVKDLIRERFIRKYERFSELGWKELEKEGEGHLPVQEWERLLVPLVFSEGKVYSFRS